MGMVAGAGHPITGERIPGETILNDGTCVPDIFSQSGMPLHAMCGMFGIGAVTPIALDHNTHPVWNCVLDPEHGDEHDRSASIRVRSLLESFIGKIPSGAFHFAFRDAGLDDRVPGFLITADRDGKQSIHTVQRNEIPGNPIIKWEDVVIGLGDPVVARMYAKIRLGSS